MTKTIGILHPGAMGVAVAQTMKNSGYEVVWAGNGRSPATHQRAESAGLTNVQTVEAVCAAADVIVSVCPPHAAEVVAEQVSNAQFDGLFLDANAISPQKAQRIGERLTAVNIPFVDGSIIGGPPTKPKQTWLHLSGARAEEVARYFAAGPLETNIVSEEIGQASALKMCFAAQTKGGAALLALVLAAAESLNVRDALEAQWEQYDAGSAARSQQRIVRVAHNKAWRFVGEMEEMVETFGAIGLPDGFHAAAAEIYQRVAQFKDAPDAPSIEAVLRALNGNE